MITTSGVMRAKVLEREGRRVRVATDTGEVWAGIASEHSPAPGDEVLTIGEDEVFVIGVLRSEALRFEAERIEIRADRLELFARAAFERFVDAYRWVKGLFQLRAGRTRSVVQGMSVLHAERVVHTADKDVKIDGQKIYLG
jgi:hypothetical protein